MLSPWVTVACTAPRCDVTTTTYAPVTVIPISLKAGTVQDGLTQFLDRVEIINNYDCVKKCQTRQCRQSVSLYSYPKVLRVEITR